MKLFIIFIVLCILVFSGCALWQNDLTPARYSNEMVQYAYDGNVPKKFTDAWKSKSELDDLSLAMKIRHEKIQADLEYQKTKDLSVYVQLASKAELYQKEAQKTAEMLFGETGLIAWGLGTLLGGGLGASLTSLYKNGTMYSENEVENIKSNVYNVLNKQLWTDSEVANEVAARILSVCQTLGITDVEKIQKIINDEKAKI